MTAPRGPERRQQPRRHEDALLHYAEQNALAAILMLDESTLSPSEAFAAMRELARAAATYRFALARAEDAARVRNP